MKPAPRRPRSLCLLPLIALAVAGPTTAAAQEQPPILRPGSDRVRVGSLSDHLARYTLYRGTGPDRQPLQEVRRRCERIEHPDGPRLRLTWTTQAMGREVLDRLELDARSLAPLERVVPMPSGGNAELTLDGARVRGTLPAQDGSVESVDVTFRAALHDASLPLLVGLRLKPGRSVRLASLPLELGEDGAEPNWLRIERQPDERIEVPPGLEVEARVFRVTPEVAGPDTKLWISDEAPYLWRKQVSVPGVGEILWELTETGD